MNLSIRPATEADIPFVAELKMRLLRDEITEVRGWDETFEFERVKNRFLPNAMHIIAADSKPVGSVGLVAEPERYKLIQLYVLPEHHRQGIATYALNEMIKLAGGKPIWLEVNHNQTAAKAFYERYGFTEFDRVGPKHYLVRG